MLQHNLQNLQYRFFLKSKFQELTSKVFWEETWKEKKKVNELLFFNIKFDSNISGFFTGILHFCGTLRKNNLHFHGTPWTCHLWDK